MNFVLPLLAVAAAGLALPVTAQDTSPAPAAEAEPKDAKEGEKICKRVALDVDSRRKEKLCLTRDEWRELNNPR
jgi:hypothetical protein